MNTAIAFLAATVTPACLTTLWYLYGQFDMFPSDDPYIWVRTRGFFTLCVGISFVHVLLLGAPAYVFLRWRNAIHWWSTAAAGTLLASAPIAIWSWPLRFSELKTNASFDGVSTVIEGVPTAAGWLQYGASVAFFGGCGALSGIIFWLVSRPKTASASTVRPLHEA